MVKVAKSYVQMYRIAYNETFMPTTKMTMVHVLLGGKAMTYTSDGCKECIPARKS